MGAEHALLVATIAVGVLASTHDRLLGDAIDVIAAAAVTLGCADNLLMTGPRCDPTFYSRHGMLLS
jgi:Flp pilus assembly pilin Flp